MTLPTTSFSMSPTHVSKLKQFIQSRGEVGEFASFSFQKKCSFSPREILRVKTDLFYEDRDNFGFMGLCILPDSFLLAVKNWKCGCECAHTLTSPRTSIQSDELSMIPSWAANPLLQEYCSTTTPVTSMAWNENQEKQRNKSVFSAYFVKVKRGVGSFPGPSGMPNCVGVSIPGIL